MYALIRVEYCWVAGVISYRTRTGPPGTSMTRIACIAVMKFGFLARSNWSTGSYTRGRESTHRARTFQSERSSCRGFLLESANRAARLGGRSLRLSLLEYRWAFDICRTDRRRAGQPFVLSVCRNESRVSGPTPACRGERDVLESLRQHLLVQHRHWSARGGGEKGVKEREKRPVRFNDKSTSRVSSSEEKIVPSKLEPPPRVRKNRREEEHTWCNLSRRGSKHAGRSFVAR